MSFMRYNVKNARVNSLSLCQRSWSSSKLAKDFFTIQRTFGNNQLWKLLRSGVSLDLTTCRQFHQRFTRAFFVQNFGAKKQKCFSLVTFLAKKHFRTKNAHVKCWWNWYLGSISPTFWSKRQRELHNTTEYLPDFLVLNRTSKIATTKFVFWKAT